jgi:hypothetical protein
MSIKPITRGALPFLLLFASGSPVQAQTTPEITFGGQVRPRLEARTPVDDSWAVFTSMRTRASLSALLEGSVRIFVQVQDVRYFGEESNTLSDFDADNFDLHQGYLELGSVPGIGGAFKVGRQEMAFAEQRLIGSVNWTQQGRSFDGARYTTSSLERLKIDLFAMKLREDSSSEQDWDSEFAGAYATVGLESAGSLDLYGLLTTDSREGQAGEFTFGGLWKGAAGPVDMRLEGSLQTGERDGSDVSAFMVGARVGSQVHEDVNLTLWYDHLSGDSDPDDDEIGVFSTLFATNHAFYGLADYFLNIPAHTGGLGLKDAALKAIFSLSPKTGLKVDLHHLRTTEKGSLSTASLANEIDLTLTHRLSSALTIMSGYSFVQAKDGMKELERLSEDAHWFHLMFNAAF